MGERTKYTPGTFSWTDLTTTDQDAAKSFYGELFGWKANDLPMGDEGTYSMMQLDGKNVAAISPQPPQQREQGVPPVWNSYVTVESADRALERAKELGGTVHADAFDVFDAGRMGVIQDPQGAFVLAWEPKSNIGAQLVNAQGALSWNELATTSMDAAAKFYSELFGWKAEPFGGSEMPYMTVQTSDGHGNGGIRQKMDQEPVPYWLVYFGAEDIDATFGKVKELGGNQLAEPMEIGEMGKIAVAQDPQGAVFALYAGRFED
jgi:predicted enzyme related to lactoylglutathione lyase